MKKNKKLVVGSRKSDLALWQARFVKNEIEKQNKDVDVIIKTITTTGDKVLDVSLSKIGDTGLFTKELEIELQKGSIDIAVHSLKDLSATLPEHLSLAAVTKRHQVQDVLIAKDPGATIDALPLGATVATGALRRKSQLKHIRPDLNIVDLRGNIPTRIAKFQDSDWDAIILARAGVERLKMERYISSYIDVETMLPAAGQGAIGIEIRKNDKFAEETVRAVHDEPTFLAVTAERSLIKNLQGGCQVPIGVFGEIKQSDLFLSAMVGSLDGKVVYKRKKRGSKTEAEHIGNILADELLKAGADTILKEIYKDFQPG